MLGRRHLYGIVVKNVIFRNTATVSNERLQFASDVVSKTIDDTNIKSSKDWKTFRNGILGSKGPVTHSNIDALTLGVCTSKQEYDLALSYVHFLEDEKIQLNLATLGKYFKLLFLKAERCELSKIDEERILELYESVRKTYPLLDALSLENIAQALSLTHKWKLCTELLNEIKITSTPNSAVYSAVIAAAFANNEDALSWKLLSEALGHDKAIFANVYFSYFNRIVRNPRKFHILKELETLLNFFHKNCLKLTPEALEEFVDHFKMWGIDFHVSSIVNGGTCKFCKNRLKSFDLTYSEFNDLKTKIFKNVIVGKDVFNKTTSVELQRFKKFISDMGTFDVVIDGLNVAYSSGVKQPPTVISGLVAAVVSHFVSQGKKVLVLGRIHMTKWPRRNWGYIQENATTFLTQDLSHDDPYLLYCALNSGKDTIIVTRDLMRSHKFLLKNPHLRLLFDRWLSQRQYHLIRVPQSQAPIFQKPLPYSIVAQRNEDHWHVPLLPADKTSSLNQWLCIKC